LGKGPLPAFRSSRKERFEKGARQAAECLPEREGKKKEGKRTRVVFVGEGDRGGSYAEQRDVLRGGRGKGGGKLFDSTSNGKRGKSVRNLLFWRLQRLP